MHYEIFTDRVNGGLPGLFPIKPTSERVVTITSSPIVGLDMDGHRFFIKNLSNSGVELAELRTLRLLGLPVPDILAIASSGDRMATNWSGTPLNEVLSGLPVGDEKDRVQILSTVGSLLRRIHSALDSLPIPVEQLNVSYVPSAHIVDTFFYKFESGERLPLDEYRRHKRSIAEKKPYDQNGMHSTSLERFYGHFINHSGMQHEGLIRLSQTFSQLADDFLSKLEPFAIKEDHSSDENGVDCPKLTIEDNGLFYGDFKPENILATRDSNHWNLRVIDPVLSDGSKYFDLAKFVSRYLIDNPTEKQRKALDAFFEGYGEIPSGNLRIYGPFTFMNLVVLERLNSLKSYIRRYHNKSSDYRLVNSLGSPDFCEQILQQTMRLTKIKDDVALAQFLS